MSPRLPGLRILIVDGAAEMRQLLEDALADEGCRVEAAEDGRAALARLQHLELDAVLVEHDESGVDGIALLRRVAGRVPSWLTSTYADEALRTRAANAGARGVLSKPFSLEELVRQLERLVHGR